jgi:hypothetical protein
MHVEFHVINEEKPANSSKIEPEAEGTCARIGNGTAGNPKK